jgi:hypothetical protein
LQRRGDERAVFHEAAAGHFSGRSKHLPRFHPIPKPSGHEKTDESREAKEKEDNDCPIDRAKPGLFRVVGRDEHSIKNMALPAHVVSNFSHASSRAWAGPSAAGGGDRKTDAKKVRKTGFVPGFDSKKARRAPGVKRAVSKTGEDG